MANRNKLLQLANDKFAHQEYDAAMLNYALVLEKHPEDKEAKTGAILTEMAMTDEKDAQALFDYYAVLQSNDKDLASEVMEEILNSLDQGVDKIANLLNDIKGVDVDETLEDGISYDDFKLLVADRNDFKRTFEDIMFSTRVVIANRDDFLDFLEQLVMHGFSTMAANYIESALQAFPNDEKIKDIYRLIDEKSLRES